MKRLLCLLWLSFGLLFAEEPIIVKLSTENKLMPLFLSKLTTEGSGYDSSYLKQLEAVLTFDLSYNGMTQAIKHTTGLEELASNTGFEGNDNLAEWKKNGVYYLIKVQVKDKKLLTRVVSINNHYVQTIDAIALTGELAKDRRQLHRLADAIFKTLFNKEGIASTHILYTIKKQASKDPTNVISEIWEADYDGGNSRQILRESNLCINPTYLPGSNSFLYITYKGGQSKLYLASLKTGQGRRLLQLPGNQLMPAASPKRDLIAFISDAMSNPDLFVQGLNQDGSATDKPRQIFTFPNAAQGCPTFNPDGSRIAFVSNKDGAPHIFIIEVPPEGNFTKKPKTTLVTKRNRENTAPSWSPDGTKIAYCSMTEGNRQIWIADLASGQERQLTQGPGNKENPTWAPDSLHLIFNSANSSSSELYLVNLNQPEAIKISSGAGEARFPCWQGR